MALIAYFTKLRTWKLFHKFLNLETWDGEGIYIYIIYINDLPWTINDSSRWVIFAGDTSIIVANHNPDAFMDDSCNVFDNIKIWFNSNLSLNFAKTKYLHFRTKKKQLSNWSKDHLQQ